MARHKSHTISNSDDIIDSWDIIARIDALESERDSLKEAAEEERSDEDTKEGLEARAVYTEWLESEDAAELKALLSLQEEAKGYSDDWRHGAALIRDSYFEEYAEQFADDIGAINKDAHWPINCIDWKKAAEDLQADYTEVDYDGVSYWVR